MTKAVLILTCVAVLLAGTSAADHYATKADYKAGRLTPGAPFPKGSGSSCQDTLVEILCPLPFVFNGDTSGSLNTVVTLLPTCNGNFTIRSRSR